MKNITKIIIFVSILFLLGLLLYFILKPRSNENFKLKKTNNPLHSVFLIDFIQKKPDLIDYKLLHEVQKKHILKLKNKKIEKYIYEGLETPAAKTDRELIEDTNKTLKDYIDTETEDSDRDIRMESRELRFKTFGISNTILGDYEGLQTRELIESSIGDVHIQLTSYLYKFLTSKKKRDIAIDIFRYVGVTAISMVLAAVGLGPLSSLFKGLLPSEADNSLNISDIEKTITDSLSKERFMTLAMNMNLNLQKIKYFMATVYLPLKVKYNASCNFDENSSENIDIIKCLNENTYDPNIVKKDQYENSTKRELLNMCLKEMDRLMYSECSSIFSDINEIAIRYNFGDSIEIAKLINTINIQLILIEISYYQEKALADSFHKNSTLVNDINEQIKKMLNGLSQDESKKNQLLSLILPSCKSSNYYYINPWLSRHIGNFDIVGDSPQNSGLISNIQRRCKEYFELFQKIIQLYYDNLEFYNDCKDTDYVRWVDHYLEDVKDSKGNIIHYNGEYKSKKARDIPLTTEKGNISNAVHFTLKKDLYLGNIRERGIERLNECTTGSNYYKFINKNIQKGDEDPYILEIPDNERITSDAKRQVTISDISYYEKDNIGTDENVMFYNNRKCGCLIDFVDQMNFSDNIKDFLQISGISELPTLKNYFKTADEILIQMMIDGKYQELYDVWSSYKVEYYVLGSSDLKKMDLLPPIPPTPLPANYITPKYAIKNLPLYYLNCVFNRNDDSINADLRIKDLVNILLNYNNIKIKYDYKLCHPFGKRYGSYADAKTIYEKFVNFKYDEVNVPENIKNFGTYCSNSINLKNDFDENLQIKINDQTLNYPGTNQNIFCKEGNALTTCTIPFISPGTEGTDLARNRSIICYNEYNQVAIKDEDLLNNYLQKFISIDQAYGLTIKESKNLYNISNISALSSSGIELEIPKYSVISNIVTPITKNNTSTQGKIGANNLQESKFIKLKIDISNIIEKLKVPIVKPVKPIDRWYSRDRTTYIKVYKYLIARKNYYSKLEENKNQINDMEFIQKLLNDKLIFSFKHGGLEYMFDIQNGYIIKLEDNIKDDINNIDINYGKKMNLINKKTYVERLVNEIKGIQVTQQNFNTIGNSDALLTNIKTKLVDIKTLFTQGPLNGYSIDVNTLTTYIDQLSLNIRQINDYGSSNRTNIPPKDTFDKNKKIKDESDKEISKIEEAYKAKIIEHENIYEESIKKLIDDYIEYIKGQIPVIKCNRKYSIDDNYKVLKQPVDMNDYILLQNNNANKTLSFYDLNSNVFTDNITNANFTQQKIDSLNKSLNIPLNFNVKDVENKLQYNNILNNSNSVTLPPNFDGTNYFEYYTPNYCRYKY